MIVMLLLTILTYGCYPSNQRLVENMIEKYADDQNYIALSGVIVEYDGSNVTIECEDLRSYITYEDEICDYYIYSEETLNLNVGDIIDFMTVPFHFYNGHKLPIVELEKKGDIVLSFDDGKKNLIEWVNTNFKQVYMT